MVLAHPACADGIDGPAATLGADGLEDRPRTGQRRARRTVENVSGDVDALRGKRAPRDAREEHDRATA